MKDKIVIQKAIPEDAEGIQFVQKETWLSTYPNPELGITRDDIEAKVNEMQQGGVERVIKRIKEDKSSQTWVARKGSKVIGFIRVQKQDEENKIRAIYILPEYQGKGTGKKLMQKALDWLGDKKKITLEVVTYNESAINFYKSFAFTVQGKTTNEAAHLPNGKELPEMLMVRN